MENKLKIVDTYTPSVHLLPIWNTQTIYDETAVFIGEEAYATLLYEPDGEVVVRDYRLSVLYEQGKDYRIEGNRIYRVKGSAIPYWEPEEYFPTQPNNPNVPIGVDYKNIEFDFDPSVQRYIVYGEPTMMIDRQIAVTYTHKDSFKGTVPPSQTDASAPLLHLLTDGLPVHMMVYGDSVAVGACASDTQYGGFISPHTPDYPHIVKSWMEDKFNADIAFENMAVGGWKAIDCVNEWDKRIAGKPIDLFMLRVGGNDTFTSVDDYRHQMDWMLARFFEEHPNGTAVLQSAETPNPQSCWVGNQVYFEDVLWELAEKYPHTVVVPVYSMFVWMQSGGKKMRSFLGNNINHPNDFGIRVYAQTILKTMFGDMFDI